ncbi:hypothetical protein NEUTE1DRAFT_50053 [Neurospora tetrasperma FGSC 2508]|uniref:Uncharacterized protein n=1 Tax=Neurospora tetrasperma (strain FGSC 2508 / ATCC MYA-4615 / P0657) TaxID=510951 RepID=F8MVX5_NEUT8|nr:uncharacterized protein NEUTE1DRAFT_50053 [Neurospora tetrasperma FGSC 2508]EGO54823.1 hypothetical protein NEUTE1DRAFT_50053 [Neurospora tetrasperma FGSC 2508]EGZ67690.1 hypothetical protein NEUTE2DRAFT_132371 [Neurospora tetrasperma FGSC 2509]
MPTANCLLKAALWQKLILAFIWYLGQVWIKDVEVEPDSSDYGRADAKEGKWRF